MMKKECTYVRCSEVVGCVVHELFFQYYVTRHGNNYERKLKNTTTNSKETDAIKKETSNDMFCETFDW